MFENTNFSTIVLKTGLELLDFEVVGKILQNLEVEKIPDFHSAAEEDDFFQGETADDVSHSFFKEWDVLFVTDRHLCKEDACITICYVSMF